MTMGRRMALERRNSLSGILLIWKPSREGPRGPSLVMDQGEAWGKGFKGRHWGDPFGR